MARQFYFDVWHELSLRGLTGSADARIAEIAAKALKEVRYHTERSADWVIRLGDGTEESHRRMQAAVDDLWMYTGEMFEVDAIELALIDAGVACDAGTLAAPWRQRVDAIFSEATLTVPAGVWMQGSGGRGGKQGVHTEHIGPMLAQMQWLQRAYPGAQW
jgi:ring-1,2-phenylacetyl-CoA epoxidase subunit PaaC